VNIFGEEGRKEDREVEKKEGKREGMSRNETQILFSVSVICFNM
jgi:hypothetical protein